MVNFFFITDLVEYCDSFKVRPRPSQKGRKDVRRNRSCI